MAQWMREAFEKIDRPFNAGISLTSDQRKGIVETGLGFIGLHLVPRGGVAEVKLVLADSIPVIRDVDFDDEHLVRGELARYRQRPTDTRELPFSFSPSPDTRRLFVANIRFDLVVSEVLRVGMRIWAPESIDARHELQGRDLRQEVLQSLGLAPIRRRGQ